MNIVCKESSTTTKIRAVFSYIYWHFSQFNPHGWLYCTSTPHRCINSIPKPLHCNDCWCKPDVQSHTPHRSRQGSAPIHLAYWPQPTIERLLDDTHHIRRFSLIVHCQYVCQAKCDRLWISISKSSKASWDILLCQWLPWRSWLPPGSNEAPRWDVFSVPKGCFFFT